MLYPLPSLLGIVPSHSCAIVFYLYTWWVEQRQECLQVHGVINRFKMVSFMGVVCKNYPGCFFPSFLSILDQSVL